MDPGLRKIRYLLEAGGSSSVPPIVPTRINIMKRCHRNAKKNMSAEGLIRVEARVSEAKTHQ